MSIRFMGILNDNLLARGSSFQKPALAQHLDAQYAISHAVPTRAEGTFRQLSKLSAVRLLREVMIAFFSLGNRVVIVSI